MSFNPISSWFHPVFFFCDSCRCLIQHCFGRICSRFGENMVFHPGFIPFFFVIQLGPTKLILFCLFFFASIFSFHPDSSSRSENSSWSMYKPDCTICFGLSPRVEVDAIMISLGGSLILFFNSSSNNKIIPAKHPNSLSAGRFIGSSLWVDSLGQFSPLGTIPIPFLFTTTRTLTSYR